MKWDKLIGVLYSPETTGEDGKFYHWWKFLPWYTSPSAHSPSPPLSNLQTLDSPHSHLGTLLFLLSEGYHQFFLDRLMLCNLPFHLCLHSLWEMIKLTLCHSQLPVSVVVENGCACIGKRMTIPSWKDSRSFSINQNDRMNFYKSEILTLLRNASMSNKETDKLVLCPDATLSLTKTAY